MCARALRNGKNQKHSVVVDSSSRARLLQYSSMYGMRTTRAKSIDRVLGCSEGPLARVFPCHLNISFSHRMLSGCHSSDIFQVFRAFPRMDTDLGEPVSVRQSETEWACAYACVSVIFSAARFATPKNMNTPHDRIEPTKTTTSISVLSIRPSARTSVSCDGKSAQIFFNCVSKSSHTLTLLFEHTYNATMCRVAGQRVSERKSLQHSRAVTFACPLLWGIHTASDFHSYDFFSFALAFLISIEWYIYIYICISISYMSFFPFR